MTALDALAALREYGLAGVMAWLFWWTLRRMMASHDTTVGELKQQLDTQALATREAGERFARVVENHMGHVTGALTRLDSALARHVADQGRWQERVLETLQQIAARLAAHRRS